MHFINNTVFALICTVLMASGQFYEWKTKLPQQGRRLAEKIKQTQTRPPRWLLISIGRATFYNVVNLVCAGIMTYLLITQRAQLDHNLLATLTLLTMTVLEFAGISEDQYVIRRGKQELGLK